MTEGRLRRVHIGALLPGLKNVLIVGIIIAKHECRRIVKKDGSFKFVSTMTIRDSSEDFVNVTAWTDEEFSKKLDDEFHIGDILEIGNPRIDQKSSSHDLYEPFVSSGCCITFSNEQSTLTKHEPDPASTAAFTSLLYIPTKPTTNFWTLADIHGSNRFQNQKNLFVDILVCVNSVGPIRKFLPKYSDDGNQKTAHEMREVVVFDRTQLATVVKLWDFDWIHLADDWQPKKQILFFSDVRVDWDEYRNSAVLTATPKTVISFSPVCQESKLLEAFAADIDLSRNGRIEAMIKTIDFRAIKRVTTIVGFQRLIGNDEQGRFQIGIFSDGPVTSIVYGYISRLNIDWPISEFVVHRCVCGSILPRSDPSSLDDPSPTGCQNPKCEKFSQLNPSSVPQFDLRIDISDFTGSINGCKFVHSGVEALICPASEMIQLTREKRSQLKLKFHLEPVKIYLMATPPNSFNRSSKIIVLRCQTISAEEMAEKGSIPPIY